MRAVLVFCEGRHDVAFVRRSLGALAGGELFKRTIRDLPAPFGSSGGGPGLIADIYGMSKMDSRQLASGAHVQPPTFESMVESSDKTLYFLIHCNGDDRAKRNSEVADRVANLVANFSEPGGVSEVAFAFVFDADESVGAREARFSADYAHYLGGRSIAHAGWVRGDREPFGLFVFHDGSTRTGTLEDAVAELVRDEWPARWQAADAYLDAHAMDTDPIRRKASAYKKAQIGVTGQFLFPGQSMTRVIGPQGLPRARFTGPASQALVAFLRAVPW